MALPRCDNDEDYELLYANLGVPAAFRGPLSGLPFLMLNEERLDVDDEGEEDQDESMSEGEEDESGDEDEEEED